MSEIKVTTSDLFGYARRLSEIAGEVGNISSRNYRAIQKFNDSCSSFQSWSFINMENQIIEKFTDFIQTLNRGTHIAMNCAYAYEEANTELINSYSGWFDGVEVNTIGGSTETYDAEQRRREEQKRAEELREMIRNGQRIDTSSYSIKTYYGYYGSDGTYYDNWGLYEKSGGCTWYAFNRWREINGSDLPFVGAGGGNATNWDERIHRDYFDVFDLQSDGDSSFIRSNTIANSEGNPGHVVYVECVVDGKVIYSEGNDKDPNHPGKIVEVSVEEFLKMFDHLIVPK